MAQVQRLIEVMVKAGAVEVEMEEAGSRLRVRLKEEPAPGAYAAPAALAVPASVPLHGAAPAAAPLASTGTEPEGEVFKSPMLGTFYRAVSPEAEPFAKAGDRVGPDTTLCIIEAMKVMNEIKAEKEFEIVDVLVKNGDPVEYGQPLFQIRF
ncbi:MAG TPA: acetyl-CoA carboxylase biotin carboxyl carrier protein [Planctomycetota bacterium]|nr:acetyl-CoA carboxylase biotin carboxyl carrier protein [Planctomycetota bacterium]